MNTNHLSPDELRAVESVLSPLSERAKFSLSLDRLLQRWDEVVTQVERGYADSIYEYTNDLATRDVIQKLLSSVSEHLRSKLTALVKIGDDRFYEATCKVDRGLTGGKNSEEHPWWFRIPRHAGKELENDLRSEGFLE